MATQTVAFQYQTGKTLTLKLYPLDSDTITASQSATERSNQIGVYDAAFTDVAAGTYRAVAYVGAVPYASGFAKLLAADGTYDVQNDKPTEIGGANTVTITVDDDSDNLLANAEVQLLSGGSLIDKQTTNGSGVATLAADDGTYTLIVSMPNGGYSSSTNTSFAVSGTTTGSVELTAHTTASTVPNTVTGQYTVYEDGAFASGVSVQCEAWARPSSSSDDNYTGVIVDYDVTNQTNGSGLVQFTNMPTGFQYKITYGTSSVIVEVANGATGSVNLNSMAVPGRS